MKPFSDYFKIPEGFNVEYFKGVMKAVYPFIFLLSIVMIIGSMALMGVSLIEIVRSRSIIKQQFLESLDPKVKLMVAAIMFVSSVAYSRWYMIVFIPDGILNLIL